MNQYLHRIIGRALLAAGLLWLAPAASGQVVVVTRPRKSRFQYRWKKRRGEGI
jgi:hypothetical protein